MAAMATAPNYRILDQVLDPLSECLSRGVATRIGSLRADAAIQHKLDELASKNAEGTLTPREESEYEAFVEALDVIAILQAKARKALRAARRPR